MRVLALLCVGIALVAARPDVSHLKKGYNYDAPSVGSSHISGSNQEQFSSGSGSHGGSFAAQPTFNSGSQGQFSSGGQGFSGSNQGSSQGVSQGFVSGGNQGFSGSNQGVSQGVTQGFVSGGNQGSSQGVSQGFVSGGNQGFSGNSGSSQGVDNNIQSVFQTNQGFQGGNQGGNAGSRFQSVETVASGVDTENRFSGNNYQQQQQNLEPIITKNFFVHAAPEERQVVQLRVIQEQARPRKNYNVIFVKTPAGPIFKAPHIQQQVQNEDKTLVYVLSNNQGQAEDIVIPAPAPAIPTKPEVFFIKYKNQQEADHKIKEIQNNYNQGNYNAQANLGGSGFSSGSGSSGQGVSHQNRFSDVDASGNSNSGSFVSQEQPQQSTFQSGVGLVSGLGSGSSLSSGLGLGTSSGSVSDNVVFSGSADKGISSGSVSGLSSGLNNGGSSQQTVISSGPANSVRFSGSSDSTGANSELEYLPVN